MEGPGLILPPGSGAYDWVETVPWQALGGSAALTANVCNYYRVRPPKSFRTTNCEIWVVTAAGNIDVGVSTRSGTAMTKVVSSGSTAVAGASAKQVIALTVDWIFGQDYYASIAADGTPATLGRIALLNANFGAVDDCALFKTAAFPIADQTAVTSGNNVIAWMRFF